MPIDLLIAFVGILAALQGLSILLTNLEVAAKQIDAQAKWTAQDGTVFEEFAVPQIEESHVLCHDFENTRFELGHLASA
jgi:hypothetical protein